MPKKRANGEGSLRKRKNGRWEGRYTAGYDPATGKPIHKSVLAKTQSEAKEKLKQAIAEAEKLDMSRAKSYTLGAWIKLWYEVYAEPRLREKTKDYCLNYINNHIIPELGNTPLEKLTTIQIQKFYNDLQKSGRIQRYTHIKLKDKGIKMFASWQDIMNMQFSNRAQPWVVDDRLVIDESMLDFMDMAKTIAENGYDLNVDPWAPEWSAAVESTDTFCYVLPSWGYQFVVKPAADTTKGQWAMCQGSVPYVKGGTWLGIYKDSPNKDLAWAFLEYCCLNSEAQQAYAAEYGEYVSLKSADQALAAGAGEEVLGGQNPFAFYNEQMEKIPSDLMTAYDGTINTAFLSAAKAYATGVLSKDDALQQFKDDVANAYPELTID